MTDEEHRKVSLFRQALEGFGGGPPEFSGENLLAARVVHDLGIAGDDFLEFVETLNGIRPVKRRVPETLVPSELSKDAYYVACSRSWLARRIPWIKRWYVSKLSAEPVTLDELYHILYQ